MFGKFFTSVFAFAIVILFTVSMAFSQDLDDVTIAGKILDANGLAIVTISGHSSKFWYPYIFPVRPTPHYSVQTYLNLICNK